MPAPAKAPAVPRLTYLRIKNCRVLRDGKFRDLTPPSVFICPDGSGKSTVLDALDLLAEAANRNLMQAWEKQNRFAGMRTRESEGDIEFEIKIAPGGKSKILQYNVSIQERKNKLAAVYLRARIKIINDDFNASRMHGE